MNELIKIEERGGIQTVNARELWERLESKRQFADWIKTRIEKYGFSENVDYCIVSQKNETMGKAAISKEYCLSLDMGKELAMVENNEQGRKIRQYFIEVENKMRQLGFVKPTGQELIALALIEAHRFLEEKDKQIAVMKPKAAFFDQVTDSKDAIEMSDAAKVLNMGIGRNTLFEILRDEGVLQKNNIPYQKYIDQGYFRVIEQSYQKPTGETCINLKTIVYQRGLDYIRRVVRKEI